MLNIWDNPLLDLGVRISAATAEIERLRVIAAAAVRAVSNPAWAGVCDEDLELERVLREAGLLIGKLEVHYGCHVDLAPGMKPDECVIDEDRVHD